MYIEKRVLFSPQTYVWFPQYQVEEHLSNYLGTQICTLYNAYVVGYQWGREGATNFLSFAKKRVTV